MKSIKSKAKLLINPLDLEPFYTILFVLSQMIFNVHLWFLDPPSWDISDNQN